MALKIKALIRNLWIGCSVTTPMFNDSEKHIIPLTEFEAVQWCIDTKRKDPLRGYLLEPYEAYKREQEQKQIV